MVYIHLHILKNQPNVSKHTSPIHWVSGIFVLFDKSPCLSLTNKWKTRYLDDSGMGPTRVYISSMVCPTSRHQSFVFFFGGGDVYPPCLGTASWESQGKNQTFPNANGHPLKKNSRPYLRDHDKATAPQSLNNPLVIMFSRMFINPLIIP